MERDPYYDTTEEWGWEGDPDTCIHGRGWDETCVECCPEDVDDYTDYEI